MKVNVSAYLSSIRPYRWMRIYEMLKRSGLTFEIVIAGPNDPDFTLPSEVKFFKTNVKPSQCFHIAASACSGETLLQIVDDIEYSDGAIREMYEGVMKRDNAMASCTYLLDGKSQFFTQNISAQILNISYLPLLPVCGLYRRDVYSKMGGLDRRFNGVMSELDLYMRMRINGYDTIFINATCNEDTNYQKKENSSLCSKFFNRDRPIFVNLWSSGGILYPIRNDIVRSFSEESLLLADQNYE